jgi:hypothetical protein
MCTMLFWNSLHPDYYSQKVGSQNILKFWGASKPKDLHRIAKIDYGHLYLKEIDYGHLYLKEIN